MERVQVDVSEIKRSIKSSRAKLIAKARESFRSVSDDCDDNARIHIQKCIDDGYLLAANELISIIYNKGTIDSFSAEQDDPFREFMSAIGNGGEADDAADELKPDAVIKAAAGRERVAGVSFESLSREEATEAAHFLARWYHLSTTRRIDDPADVEELLLLFGFQVRNVRKLEAGRGWVEMFTGDRRHSRSVYLPAATLWIRSQGAVSIAVELGAAGVRFDSTDKRRRGERTDNCRALRSAWARPGTVASAGGHQAAVVLGC